MLQGQRGGYTSCGLPCLALSLGRSTRYEYAQMCSQMWESILSVGITCWHRA